MLLTSRDQKYSRDQNLAITFKNRKVSIFEAQSVANSIFIVNRQKIITLASNPYTMEGFYGSIKLGHISIFNF